MHGTIGPFRLEGVLGRGGMGEVWRAVHVDLGVPVAVKVGLARKSDAAARAEFEQEAQRVASLDHPNVVRILDVGEVPPGADPLAVGAPYLVMELAGEGSVSDRRPRSFVELKHVLTGALAGLGHAHAHGLTHRDIKPGNLLIAGPRSTLGASVASLLDARIIVSDFGISLGDRRGADEGRTVGTPQYMPPEQFGALWRDQGPWTDVYSLGIMAWTLVTGASPFSNVTSVQAWAHAHVLRPLPVFEPRYAVPDGFEAWVRRALAKQPADRFGYAAEALEVLQELGSLHQQVDEVQSIAEATRYNSDLAEPEARPSLDYTRDARRRATRWNARPYPRAEVDRTRALDGAGLGLFALRDPPLLGRDDLLDQLWAELVATSEQRRAHGVLLAGAEGTGKSRLLNWVAHCAAETGAGIAAQTDGSLDEPLRHLVLELIDGHGMDDPAELRARLARNIEQPAVVARMADWLLDLARPPASEQQALLIALLMPLTRTQVVLLGLEALHSNPDLQRLAQRLLELQAPVFWVATSEERAGIEIPGAVHRTVDPLDEATLLEVLDAQLGLDGNLARTLTERAAGNPGMLIELIAASIQSGVLLPGRTGFQLAPGRTLALPPGRSAVWRARLRTALAGRPEGDAAALGVAALLEVETDGGDWLEVCERLGVLPSRDLVAHLRVCGVLRRGRKRLAFLHPGLRAIAAERAPDATHRTIAEMLLEEPRPDWGRVARYLLAAQASDTELLEPLHQAIVDQLLRSDVRDRILLDALAERVNDNTPEACDWRLLEAWRARLTRDPSRAVELAETALAWAANHGAAELEIRAAIQRSTLHHVAAEYDEAAAIAHRAFDLADQAGDAIRIIKALTAIADADLRRGRPGEALKLFRGAIEAMPDDHPDTDRIVPLLGIADAQRALGDRTAARQALQQAAALPGIDLGKQAHIENALGDLCRGDQDLESAVQHYTSASRLYQLLGSAMGVYPELNLGLVGLELGRVGEVYTRMTQLLGRIQNPSAVTAAFARVVRLPCVAAAADGDFEVELAWLEAFIASTGIVERDVAGCAERAAEWAWAAARPERAIAALQVARQQWSVLGDEGRVGRIDRRLERWRQQAALLEG